MKRHNRAVAMVVLCLIMACAMPADAQARHDLGRSRTTIELLNPAGFRADGVSVDKLLADVSAKSPRKSAPGPTPLMLAASETVADGSDVEAEVNDLFYRRGWTDGLPIVAPTRQRVEKMLQGTGLDPKFVVATLDPMGGEATVEKIAINAVMAGCKPEYMPVLMAAVEALADTDINLLGYATTTSPDTTLLILSGPVIHELGINSAGNTMGRGTQANSTIGRAVQLIVSNVGGSKPRITDLSTLGNPGEYGWVVAENMDISPWPSINLDLDMPANASLVTVTAAEGLRGVIASYRNSDEFLHLVADHMVGLAAQRREWPVIVLVLAQDTVARLAKDGWTKEKIRVAILQYTNDDLDALATKEKLHDDSILMSTAARGDHMKFQIHQFLILVAGGTGEKSMIIPGWLGDQKAATREIQLRGQ